MNVFLVLLYLLTLTTKPNLRMLRLLTPLHCTIGMLGPIYSKGYSPVYVWGFFYDASFGSFWRIAKLCHDRGNSYCAYFTPAINCQTFNKHDSSFCIWHTALGLHHPKSLAAAVALVGMALSWKIATAVKPVISFEKSSLICSLNSQGCFSG